MYRGKILTLALLAVPLFAFACGDDPESPPATDVPEGGAPDVAQPDASTNEGGTGDSLPKAGSRLVPQFVTTSDGLKVFGAIWDTKLETVCYPQQNFDVAKRCAPLASDYASDLFYADAACTRPVVKALADPGPGCSAKKFVQVQTGTGQESCVSKPIFTVHKIVAAKLDLPKVYSKGGGGAGPCADSGEPAGSFTELTPIPSSDLVKITDEIEPASAAIARHVSAGDDGSRFPESDLRDISRKNAICTPGVVADGKTSCIPSGDARADVYTDDGCTTRGVLYNECAKADDPNAGFVNKYTTVNCEAQPTTYAVGAKRPTRDAYYGSPGNCTKDTLKVDVFDIGAEVPSSTFPELLYVETGGTRILGRTYTSQGKVVSQQKESFFDKTLGTYCNGSLQPDGKRYCVPVAAGGGAIVYSDANCQTRIAAELTSDCVTPKFMREPVDAPSVCGGRVPGIYQVGTKLQGTTAYTKTVQGACNPATNIKALYALGPLMPASSFAELTEVK